MAQNSEDSFERETPLCTQCTATLVRRPRKAWMRWVPRSQYFRCPECRTFYFLAFGRLFGPWTPR